MLVEDVHDICADLTQLRLDFAAVALDNGQLLLGTLGLLLKGGFSKKMRKSYGKRSPKVSAYLLLDGGHDAPRGTASADNILVGNGKKVALLDGELNVQCRNLLHGLHHFCKVENKSSLKQTKIKDQKIERSKCFEVRIRCMHAHTQKNKDYLVSSTQHQCRLNITIVAIRLLQTKYELNS